MEGRLSSVSWLKGCRDLRGIRFKTIDFETYGV